MKLRVTLALALAALVLTLAQRPARADGPDPKEVQQVLDKAVAYLAKSQAADGSFSAGRAGPGITAIVAAGLLRNGAGPDDPVAAKAMAYLEKSIKKDGGVYDKGLANYTTSVALMAFKEANKGGKYDAVIANGVKFIKGLQQADDKNPNYGGVGYDGPNKTDLSNTQYFLDALQAAGLGKDDPAVQKALTYVGRCQNLPGESNASAWAKKVSDDDRGGFVYRPDADDPQHKTADGGLRSQGAMTYAGLKSFLYAGVDKKDPRVESAVKWIRSHYTLDENPGLKQAGLFYYYHTFAKAMDALGEDPFVDAKGTKHDWRKELFEALKKRQRADGSFINEGDRAFGEADPNLATAFAVLTLSYCKPAKK